MKQIAKIIITIMIFTTLACDKDNNEQQAASAYNSQTHWSWDDSTNAQSIAAQIPPIKE